MKLLKELKSFLILVFVFGFFFSATMTSCGNKRDAGDTTEQSGEEHPGNDEEHPNNGEEHPDN